MMKDIEKIRKDRNFRELGGYETTDGKHVKKGMFYRCGALADLNEEELEIVRSLGIKTILDLRSDYEVVNLKDPVIKGAKYIHASAMVTEAQAEIDLSPEALQKYTEDDFMARFYAQLPFMHAYSRMFDEILRKKVPILFHCSAGKDRTGVGAYLILIALGVDKETAIRDYMLTNEFRKETLQKILERNASLPKEYQKSEDDLMVYFGTKENNIRIVDEMILTECGTYEAYFEKVLHVTAYDLKEMKNTFLE